MGAPAGKAQSGAAVTCRASTIRASLSGWLCLCPPAPASLSTWERGSHRGPLEPTLSPQSGAFSVDGAPGPGFHIRAAYLPKGTRVGPSGPLACPQATTQRNSSPNRLHQEGPAKNQEEWGPPTALWLFLGPKEHRALLGPVANFALPCRPQGSREG